MSDALEQVTLSLGSRKVPVGQVSMHLPWESTKPGKQPEHCTWSIVDATLKLEYLQLVHLEGQAMRSNVSVRKYPQGRSKLTVTLVLVVISHKSRPAAHTIAVRADTGAVEAVLARTADDAVSRGGSRARLAERRAWLARRPVAEAAVGAHGTRARRRLRCNALRAVVRVLSEPRLAGQALAVAVCARGATKAADCVSR